MLFRSIKKEPTFDPTSGYTFSNLTWTSGSSSVQLCIYPSVSKIPHVYVVPDKKQRVVSSGGGGTTWCDGDAVWKFYPQFDRCSSYPVSLIATDTYGTYWRAEVADRKLTWIDITMWDVPATDYLKDTGSHWDTYSPMSTNFWGFSCFVGGLCFTPPGHSTKCVNYYEDKHANLKFDYSSHPNPIAITPLQQDCFESATSTHTHPLPSHQQKKNHFFNPSLFFK